MSFPVEYVKAYERAKQELAELIASQDRLERRKVELRKTIESLKELCEGQEVSVNPSQEADYLLEHVTLSEEIETVVKSQWPVWLRPSEVRGQLEKLGRDLSKYQNPQATIHMILKRLTEQGAAQERIQDGKQVYRCPPMWQSIADNLLKMTDPSPRASLNPEMEKFYKNMLAAGERSSETNPILKRLKK